MAKKIICNYYHYSSYICGWGRFTQVITKTRVETPPLTSTIKELSDAMKVIWKMMWSTLELELWVRVERPREEEKGCADREYAVRCANPWGRRIPVQLRKQKEHRKQEEVWFKQRLRIHLGRKLFTVLKIKGWILAFVLWAKQCCVLGTSFVTCHPYGNNHRCSHPHLHWKAEESVSEPWGHTACT
jgi:hypothetical protein